jgi:hypothetical protein
VLRCNKLLRVDSDGYTQAADSAKETGNNSRGAVSAANTNGHLAEINEINHN